jgi:hypothetical protein
MPDDCLIEKSARIISVLERIGRSAGQEATDGAIVFY